MAAADSTKLLIELGKLQREDIRIQSERINNLIERDSLRVSVIRNCQSEISVMADQRKLFEAELTNMNKLLKKEKRKRWWTAFGGIVGIAGAFYIGTKF